MKVIVTHYSDILGLTATLIMLQTQLELPEEIIVVDTSPEKTGLSIARRYNYNLVPIKVVCEKAQINKAWNIGLEVAGESDVLIINDDLVMPMDLIKRLNYVLKEANTYCVVPETVGREFSCPEINMEFKPYSTEAPAPLKTEWMPGFCYVLSKKCVQDVGKIDEGFDIWFGDTDYEQRIKIMAEKNGMMAIVKERKAFVYHFGGKSQKYKDEKTLKQIAKDRNYYYQKYPNEKPKTKN